MAQHLVEVFTAGCPLCDKTVKLVRDIASDDCNVQIWDLRSEFITQEGREKLTRYGVHRVPAVVIDGTLADCCYPQQPISREALLAAGISQR
ncbi:thioredoxin family protein [Oscillatoria sp. CS-180]|uniref:thioredoxin family protein n=1 Tax=Oscillatoria sp. CS-180 TaxID=3021720 RepID=UPI00232D545A|nr:thioredoxin family protein [Oscillatoria sp. CS-180]MDB9529713.1 thioredoxin family protein [Oscillatoria sp. CS-180]